MKRELSVRVRRLGGRAVSVGAAALIAVLTPMPGASRADAETLRVATNSMPVEKGDIHFAYSASSVMPNMAFFDSLT